MLIRHGFKTFKIVVQDTLDGLMRAASASTSLMCLDIRGAVLNVDATELLVALLGKCPTLQELRVSAESQQHKSKILRSARRISPQCLLVVTTPMSDDLEENSMLSEPYDPPAILHSPSTSSGTGRQPFREVQGLLQLAQGNSLAIHNTNARRTRSSMSQATLRSSKQSRQSFKQESGLFKGSSSGGVAQRGAQVFIKADRRGTGFATLKGLSKALKSFKIDGFSGKKVRK